MSQVTFHFRLNPGLKDLVAGVIGNPNFELFKKTRQITVNKGAGTAYNGTFTPLWTNLGLVLKVTGITSNNETVPDLIKTGAINF